MSSERKGKKRRLGPRSLFGQITVTMVCFAMALLVLVYVYLLYQNSRNFEEQMIYSGTEMLEQSGGAIHQVLDDLSLMLNSTLMRPDVIPLAISPDMRDFENIRAITDALTSAAGSSTLIDAVYLYSAWEDLGLSSDYTLSNYQDYSYAAVLARFHTRKSKLTPYEAHGTTSYFYTENSDIYLIQGFSNIKYDKCSCYILFHLDSEQLYRTVNSAGDASMLFFNSAGEQMFVPQDHEQTEAVYQRVSQEGEASGSFLYDLGSGKSSYVSYRIGPLTGWTCVYVSRPVSTLSARYLHSNLTLALATLSIGLFCITVIVLSARWISRPLSQLISKMQTGGASARARQSEWEFLEQTYAHLLSQKEELEQYLPLATESLHEQIFRALLHQEDLAEESVQQQLALIHSPFTINTPCAVLLVDVQPAEDDAPDQLSRELVVLNLRGKLGRYLEAHEIPFHILESSGDLCLICGFPPDQVENWENVKEEFRLLAEKYNMLSWGASGSPCGLMRLADSLADAQNDLEYNRYYSGPTTKDSSGEQLQTAYIGEIRSLLTTIRREDVDRLQAALPELLEDIYGTCSRAETRQLYQLLLDLLLEQIATLRVDCGDLTSSLQGVPDDLLCQAAEQMCQEIIRRLQGQFRSGQQVYIDRAKEYILSRYNDPNLSLESTAKYVGINPTYFSRIFKNIERQNFNTYLNQCRVDNAKRLLMTSDMRAQEIGFLTGFCSVATFFRVFKKHTGMTPKQFRQNIRQEEAPS